MACALLTPSFLTSRSTRLCTLYPSDPRAKLILKDNVLVKCRVRPSAMDTRVYRGDLVSGCIPVVQTEKRVCLEARKEV